MGSPTWNETTLLDDEAEAFALEPVAVTCRRDNPLTPPSTHKSHCCTKRAESLAGLSMPDAAKQALS